MATQLFPIDIDRGYRWDLHFAHKEANFFCWRKYSTTHTHTGAVGDKRAIFGKSSKSRLFTRKLI